jgi:hypothetical protein
MKLPGHQVSKSQAWPAELLIEPDTNIMQRNLGRQARLKSAEVMGPFAIEAEGMPALLIHGLHALADSSQPAAKPPGPRHAAIALRGADNLGAIGPPPGLVVGMPLEALVDDIRPTGWGAHARQARMGMAAESKERLCQGVIFGTGRAKAKASDHPPGVDRQEHMEAFIPAQPVAPAHIGQSRQPAGSSALGIPGGDPGAIEGFIGTALGGQEPDEIPQKRHQGRVVLADLPIELFSGGQRWTGGPEMALGIAVKAALPATGLPRPEQGQGHHLAPAQGGLWSRVQLRGQRSLAKVVCHNVKSRQDGVHSDQSICSFSWGRESNATGQRHLPCNRQLSIHTKRLNPLWIRDIPQHLRCLSSG